MQMYLGEDGKKYYWRVVDVSNIADVETLETKFELTEEMAKYVLDSNERARVEYDGKNLLVVIHVPAFTQKVISPWKTAPLPTIKLQVHQPTPAAAECM